MIHIILDQQNSKGMINIKGSNLEVANDFANFIHGFLSTSSALQLMCMAFWLISRPLVATPPALTALPGAKIILASMKASMA